MDDIDHIEKLIRGLPRDLSPAQDLWPRIAARIDTPAEHRLRQLPRDIEPGRDLWPTIAAAIDQTPTSAGTRVRSRRPWRKASGLAGLAGVAATAVLATLVAMQLFDAPDSGDASIARSSSGAPGLVDQLPPRLMESLSSRLGAPAGTLAADLEATAGLIQRDFEMVRNERLRIERALSNDANDMNLREQWRHVYVAELKLINEIENLGNIQLTRSEI